MSFDVLKFSAIFAVLWGHSLQYFFDGKYYDNSLYRIIYSFHMPLFMAVVGFFAYKACHGSLLREVGKRFRQLIVPALSYGVMSALFEYATQIGGDNINLNGYVGICVYCLWFLKSAFICEVVFLSCCVVRKISVICVVLTLVLSQYVCIFNINIMYPCFIAGVLVRIYYDGFKRHALWMLVVSGAVWLTMLVAWDATYWDVPEVRNRWFVNILDVPTATVVRLMYRLSIGLAGGVFFISLAEYVFGRWGRRSGVINWMSVNGRETLGIYLFQTLLLEKILPAVVEVRFSETWIFDFVVTPVISVVVLVVCLLLIRLTNMYVYTRYLILGKRLPPRVADAGVVGVEALETLEPGDNAQGNR